MQTCKTPPFLSPTVSKMVTFRIPRGVTRQLCNSAPFQNRLQAREGQGKKSSSTPPKSWQTPDVLALRPASWKPEVPTTCKHHIVICVHSRLAISKLPFIERELYERRSFTKHCPLNAPINRSRTVSCPYFTDGRIKTHEESTHKESCSKIKATGTKSGFKPVSFWLRCTIFF